MSSEERAPCSVRADFLASLLTDEALSLTRHVLRLKGAWIEGNLDLEARTLLCPLDFESCDFFHPVKVDQARVSRLTFQRCRLPALEARQLEVRGDLSLAGSHLNWVGVLGARIGGRFDLTGVRLSNEQGMTLSGEGLDVGQDMLCRNGFHSAGELSLVGTHIRGRLDLVGADSNPGGVALRAAGMSLDADVRCRSGFRIEGEASLVGARIGGLLDFSKAKLHAPGGAALDLEGATVAKLALPAEDLPVGILNLTNTRVGHLDDNWLDIPYKACLTGLVYETLSERASALDTRLQWLASAVPEEGWATEKDKKQPKNHFAPQAYEQGSQLPFGGLVAMTTQGQWRSRRKMSDVSI